MSFSHYLKQNLLKVSRPSIFFYRGSNPFLFGFLSSDCFSYFQVYLSSLQVSISVNQCSLSRDSSGLRKRGIQCLSRCRWLLSAFLVLQNLRQTGQLYPALFTWFDFDKGVIFRKRRSYNSFKFSKHAFFFSNHCMYKTILCSPIQCKKNRTPLKHLIYFSQDILMSKKVSHLFILTSSQT